MEPWVAKKHASLAAPLRVQTAIALRECHTKLTRLPIAAGLIGQSQERTLCLRVHAEAQREAAKLDGGDGLTTDLPQTVAGTEVVHERSQDLALVEQALRTCKTAHREVRPVDVRTTSSTRGHVLGVR
jgi:hypothetical protein